MNKIIQNNYGGRRQDAGRKTGTGKFSEATTVVRLPVSQVPVVKDFLAEYQRKQQLSKLGNDLDAVGEILLPALDRKPIKLPLFLSKVPAGFPSPAEDHIEKRLDPTEYLIDQEDATFFANVDGYSMIDVGLMPGDKAVVDRSKLARVGDIVLVVIYGDFTIKTLSRKKDGTPLLLPANSTGTFAPIEITEGMNFEIWGVVTGSFRRFK